MHVVRLAAKRTRGLCALVVLLLGATAGSAGAQTFSVSLGAFSAVSGVRPQLVLALESGRVGAATVSLALAYRDAAQLTFGLSESRSFGPLGNVVLGFTTSLRTDAAAQAEVTARGVIGPVAVRLALGAFSHDAGRFDPAADASGLRPRLRGVGGAQHGFSVRLGGSGRLNRSLVLEVEPEYYRVAGGSALRFESRLRWLRAFGDNELRAILLAYSSPVMGEAHLGVGVGVVLGRGRAPDWTFTASVGHAGGRMLPGASAEIVERLAGGQVVSLSLAAEPYRRDLAPYRASAAFDTSLGQGTLKLAGSVALAGVDMLQPVVAVSVGYSLPANLR